MSAIEGKHTERLSQTGTQLEHEIFVRLKRSIGAGKNGAGGGNRTHGLGIMRPSLYH